MADSDTLGEVAELLAPDQRERFYAMMARFKQVPEDDEYLLILEAIGFMTLLWTEIPNRIREILAGAEPAARQTPNSTEYLLTEIRAVMQEGRDLPSYEDLRNLAHELRDQHSAFLHAARKLSQGAPAKPPRATTSQSLPLIMLTLLVGMMLGYLACQRFPDLATDLRRLLGNSSLRQINHGIVESHAVIGNQEDRVLCRNSVPVVTKELSGCGETSICGNEIFSQYPYI